MSDAKLVLVPVLQAPGALSRLSQPTEGDALYAAQRHRGRILERTARGFDYQGIAFAPYSTKGPYYYYPNGRVGKNRFTAKQNKAAVTRLIKRIGVIESHTDKEISFQKTRDGQGIRFPDYAAFKASLGRLGVDLRGPRAPHMLQALAVGVGVSRDVGDDRSLGLYDLPEPAREVVLGVYGEEAARASGHNEGVPGRLPKRRFLDASDSDIQIMQEDILGRRKAAITAALNSTK